MIKVFISYAREKLEITKKIESELGTDYTIYFDLKLLHAGDAWNEKIRYYLYDSEVLILLWSKEAKNSELVMEELELALNDRKKIVLILLEEIYPPEEIEHLHRIQLKDDSWLKELKETLNDYESELKKPKSYRQGEPVPIEFIDIPAGDFPYSKSGHKVHIKGFQIAKFPITVREYRRFAPLDFNEVSQHEDLPATNISWDQATEFCEWVKNKTRKEIRLPTEREWEYAAKAGVRNLKYATDSGKISRELANYDGLYFGVTTDPTIKTNPFGIYAMSGNIWEWCLENEDKNINYRVVKGGSWRDPKSACQCSFRLYFHRSYANIYTGFRVVRDIK